MHFLSTSRQGLRASRGKDRSETRLRRTDNCPSAVLDAVNLGGQVAGAFYGEAGFPPEWLGRLCMSDEIGRLADRLRAQPKAP